MCRSGTELSGYCLTDSYADKLKNLPYKRHKTVKLALFAKNLFPCLNNPHGLGPLGVMLHPEHFPLVDEAERLLDDGGVARLLRDV